VANTDVGSVRSTLSPLFSGCWLLGELALDVPGAAAARPGNSSAAGAGRTTASRRPPHCCGARDRIEVDGVRVGLCWDLIADIRRLDKLAANGKQTTEGLDEHGTRLQEADEIGAVTAAA